MPKPMDFQNYLPVSAEVAGEPALACPVCGDEYVHPVAIECYSPGTEKGLVIIDTNGVTMNPTHPPVGRGTLTKLKFHCESGHAFEYNLEFHKGLTFLTRFMSHIPNEIQDWPNTIWRN